MHAIVLTDNQDVDLGPLNELILFPLLPVAGKTIVLHVLEQLHRSGIRSVTVISRDSHSELDAAIDTGPLLGMSVHFTNQMPDFRRMDDNILVIGTSQLVDYNWEYVEAMHSNTHSYGVTRLVSSPSETLGYLLRAHSTVMIPDTWGNNNDCKNTVTLGLPKILKLNSLSNYVDANFKLLHGEYNHHHPAGREISPHLYISPKAHISSKALETEHAYVGSHSRVDKRARLSGDVVIGDNVLIDKGACISNSLIMDGTYIGAMTSVDNAIVKGNMLIKVNSGLCLTIDDPMLLS